MVSRIVCYTFLVIMIDSINTNPAPEDNSPEIDIVKKSEKRLKFFAQLSIFGISVFVIIPIIVIAGFFFTMEFENFVGLLFVLLFAVLYFGIPILCIIVSVVNIFILDKLIRTRKTKNNYVLHMILRIVLIVVPYSFALYWLR